MKKSELKQLIREVIISEIGVDPKGNLVGFASPEEEKDIERMKVIFDEVADEFRKQGYIEDPLDGKVKIDPEKAEKVIKIAYDDYFGDKLKAKGYSNLATKNVRFINSPGIKEMIMGYIEATYTTFEGYDEMGAYKDYKEEVNESSMFENHIWDNVKRMRHNLEDLRRFGSPQEAIKVLDRIIDYLKDVKADIEYKSSQE